jgi:hypothetical protein
MLRNAYGNLTEAYLMTGRVEEALKARAAAIHWVEKQRSWYARVVHMAEDGCHQLLLGNLAGALSVAADAEQLAAGRERAVPHLSAYQLLKTLRIRETAGRGQQAIMRLKWSKRTGKGYQCPF